jgi:hypothetical protein
LVAGCKIFPPPSNGSNDEITPQSQKLSLDSLASTVQIWNVPGWNREYLKREGGSLFFLK